MSQWVQIYSTVEVSHVRKIAALGQLCVVFILKLELKVNQWLMFVSLPTSKSVIQTIFA